jgi:hypothetical protein
MSPQLQESLFARYPLIFAERALGPQQTAIARGIEAPDAWYWLIDGLCAALQRSTGEREEPQIVATQVKEKLGRLRFYVRRNVSDAQRAMIELTCDFSERWGSPSPSLPSAEVASGGAS